MGFFGTLICAAGLLLAVVGLANLASAKTGTHVFDDMAALAAAVERGVGTWAARERGECCTCGHDWDPGEIIGCVTQAYVVLPDGMVVRSPGTRLACLICVERQRVEGDLSIAWAREVGLL